MKNVKSYITSHNNNILATKRKPNALDNICNCRRKEECSLKGKCLTRNIVYRADITTASARPKMYIGITANNIKERYRNHVKLCEMRDIVMKTELSKYVWELKDRNCPLRISWSIVKRTVAYSAGSRSCNLCDSEKLCTLKATKNDILNKRSEIFSKCTHQRKFLAGNFSHARTNARL